MWWCRDYPQSDIIISLFKNIFSSPLGEQEYVPF